MDSAELRAALDALYPGKSLREQTTSLGSEIGKDQRTILRWVYANGPSRTAELAILYLLANAGD